MTAQKKKKIVNKVKGKPKKGPAKSTLAMAVIIAQFIVIIILAIALTTPQKCTDGGSFANGVQNALKSSKKSLQKRYGDMLNSDRVMGKKDSKAKVIMYVDMQCPACAQMMPMYRQIYEKYKDKAAFTVRYYVIESHVYARPAAIAVEAAAKQGFYWEMLNAVFEYRSNWAYVNNNDLLTERLAGVFETASGGKGNKEKFLSDLNDASLAKKVDNDNQIGRKDNITATPTIVIGGEDIDFSESELDVDDLMSQKIDSLL